MLIIFTMIVVFMLIFTNALTDASNSISTLVGTKVMSFRKASLMSAVFDFLGVVVMSFVNISIAGCISNIVTLSSDSLGITAFAISMLSVVLFSLWAMKFGIPTSETHGLMAGLTGSGIAISGISAINFMEWGVIVKGLVLSIVGATVISFFICIFRKKCIDSKNTRKAQILSACGMAFIHGAQDGQKFVGFLIILCSIITNTLVPVKIEVIDYIGIILATAFTMAIGVGIGGKKIVNTIGNGIVKLNNQEALNSDISSLIVLIIASILGLPVSTTHSKIMSIIGVGGFMQKKIDRNKFISIIKMWFLTFPVCAIFSFVCTNIVKLFLF